MDHFSVTQLGMYLRCPAQYEFRYIEGRILPPTSALTKGRCVHKGAEHNYRQKERSFADVSLEEVTDTVASEFDRLAVETIRESGEDKGKVKDVTLALSALYHQEVAPTVQPLFMEHEFCIPVGGVPLLGYIDVIDDGLMIRDIKTASRTPGVDEAASSLQLSAYALVYRELIGDEEQGVALDVLVQTKQPKVVTVTAKKTQGQLDRLRSIMAAVVGAIGAGKFYPNPSNFLCSPKTCGYWSLCHQRYGGVHV